MSRDICDTCGQPVIGDPGHRPGSRRVLRQYPRSGSIRWLERTLTGVEGDDRDLVLVDDGEDPAAGVGRADLQVVQPSGAPQGDRALAVGGVVAEPEVAPADGAEGSAFGVARYASPGVRRPIARCGRCSL